MRIFYATSLELFFAHFLWNDLLVTIFFKNTLVVVIFCKIFLAIDIPQGFVFLSTLEALLSLQYTWLFFRYWLLIIDYFWSYWKWIISSKLFHKVSFSENIQRLHIFYDS